MSGSRGLLTLAPLATGGVIFAYYYLEKIPRSTRIALDIVAWVGAVMTVVGALIWMPDVIDAFVNRWPKYRSAWEWFLSLPFEARLLLISMLIGTVFVAAGYALHRFDVVTSRTPKVGRRWPSAGKITITLIRRIELFYGDTWRPTLQWSRWASMLWVSCIIVVALEYLRAILGGVRLFGSPENPPDVAEWYWFFYMLLLVFAASWAFIGPFVCVLLWLGLTINVLEGGNRAQGDAVSIGRLRRESEVLRRLFYAALGTVVISTLIVLGTVLK